MQIQPQSVINFVNYNSYDNYDIVHPKKNPLRLYYLSFNLFDYVPKNFTITTQNGSYPFNVEMLKETSLVISKYISKNPDTTQFHIDIKDDSNVMDKIKEMYCGKKVDFEENELNIVRRITSALNIFCCPSFMKPDRLKNKKNYHSSSFGYGSYSVIINKRQLEFYFDKFPKSFKISTKKNEYMVNTLGINSSTVIKEYIDKNPDSDSFFYDFDDEFDTFQVICDFFNCKPAMITTNNMNILLKIVEELQIDCAIDNIKEFIELYEKAVQKIDEKSVLIDPIVELCHFLYDIQKVGVEKVHEEIIKSNWIQTQENVQEFISYVIQAVNNNLSLHPYIMDLLLLLDKSGNDEDKSELKILMPFLIKQIMFQFPNSKFNSAFVFRLYQKKLITIDEIVMKILTTIRSYQIIKTRGYFHSILDDSKGKIDKEKFISKLLDKFDVNSNSDSTNIKSAIYWFLPELLTTAKDAIKAQIESDKFVNLYLPDKIDSFIKMRESGVPDDEVSIAIRNDDVDSLQIILNSHPSLTNIIPFNLFDFFAENGQNTYINYAAMNGSIKCFKYLLLNHHELDGFSFCYAVFGGNVEIIRIVDQYCSTNDIKVNYKFSSDDYYTRMHNEYRFCGFSQDTEEKEPIKSPIIPAIMKHQNDLFDWILEHKYINKGITGNNLYDIAYIVTLNGNAHAFIQCVDKGLDLSSLSTGEISRLLESSSSYGFYKITQLIISLLSTKQLKNDLNFILRLENSVYYGNLSLVKLYFSVNNAQYSIDSSLSVAAELGYLHIIKYLLETDCKDHIEFKDNGIIQAFGKAVLNHQDDVFDYFFEKAMFTYILDINSLFLLLSYFCYIGDLRAVQSFTDFIYKKDCHRDFSEPLMYAACLDHSDICKYLIERKVKIDYFKLVSKKVIITDLNKEIFVMLYNSADEEVKESFLGELLNESIQNQNIEVIEFLLEKNSPYDDALFEAVSSRNIDIVNIILNHSSKPSFINRISSEGTALNKAVVLNEINIVKRLLSLPGIDPNLYAKNNNTPLVSAITNFNLDMINLILDFYGDDIESQAWQLNEALKEVLLIISDQISDVIPVHSFGSKKRLEKDEILSVFNRLFQIQNIDLNCRANKYTLLTYACETGQIDLVTMLIKSGKVNVNSYAPTNGNTPLMIAIQNDHIDIAKLLIELPSTDINLRNYNRQTALTIAVEKDKPDIVCLIVNNKKFDPEESLLDYAFFKSGGKIAEQLFELSFLDVNYKFIHPKDKNQEGNNYQFNMYTNHIKETIKNKSTLYLFETTLIHAVINNDIQKIDLIIKHPSFNPIKSQVKVAMFASVNTKNLNVFRTLLSIVGNDVNIRSQSEETLLSYSIRCKCEEITEEIINDKSFDCQKNDIVKSFLQTFTFNEPEENQYPEERNQYANNYRVLFDASLKTMDLLYQYDVKHQHLIDFNKLLPSGKSFFTILPSNLNNSDGVAALLLKYGVDPDAPDNFGDYPLKYVIQKELHGAAHVLISSGKVDLMRKNTLIEPQFFMSNSEGATYLHFAACLESSKILEELLSLGIYDINCTDGSDETPLAKAIKHRSIENVELLFSKDELDYLHCCNNDMGAIDAIKSILDDDSDEILPDSKDDYLYYLIQLMNRRSI